MSAEYQIRFEPARKRVRVEFNGTRIADSARALVVHETRLAPAYYFPADDVRMDLLAKTGFTTHCPFKGNAGYWTLKVGDRVAENAAWAYEEPYREAEKIRGYLSFYRHKVLVLDEGGDAAETREGVHANPLADWLLKEAWKAGSSAELAEQFLHYLRGAGYPVDRSTVIVPTLHPQIFATVLVWRADTPGIRTVYEPHDILQQPKFADSPFAPIIRGAGGVRRRLEEPDCPLDFPVVRDLHKEGATDYVAMPFRFSDGQINVMSMTSFGRGGFSTAHLGEIYEVLPMLGRMFEVHAQRRTATALLETYLGRPHRRARAQGTGEARRRRAHPCRDLVLRFPRFDAALEEHGAQGVPAAPEPLLLLHGGRGPGSGRRGAALHRRRGSRDLYDRREPGSGLRAGGACRLHRGSKGKGNE